MSSIIQADTLRVAYPVAAGLDVHKTELKVSRRIVLADGRGNAEVETRTVSAILSGIMAMIAWPVSQGVNPIFHSTYGISANVQ